MMKDLIEFVAKSLVDAPDSVEVTEFGDDEASIIKLKVSKDDLGKVIGKKGRTAKAMRTILSAAALKVSKRSTLEIIE
ncbi:MAG: KH domain-containing protein [Deltaproteobacteria bacterium]|nr:KH domain-containing protein [Deltaproteobacteria bacterium]